MGKAHCENRGAKSKGVETITIPADIVAQLEALPRGHMRYEFEPWQDEVIRKYVAIKGIPAVAKILGVSASIVRRRWNELRGNK
jgi:hypothetical protein